jgi:hypothetical protein
MLEGRGAVFPRQNPIGGGGGFREIVGGEELGHYQRTEDGRQRTSIDKEEVMDSMKA